MALRHILTVLATLVIAVHLPLPTAAADISESSSEILLDETTFRVNGTRGTLSRKLRIRVNGPDGRGYGRMPLHYDSFRNIRRFDGQITNLDGRRIKRLDRDDITDRPGSDGISLYSDFRTQTAELYHDSYPYIIEWEYEIRYETLLIWPSWYPQRQRDPVRQATLTVDAPSDFEIGYHTQWLDVDPQVEVRRGRRVLSWSINSLPAQPSEPLGPATYAQMPAIHFSAGEFRLGRWTGSLSSWQDFGNWYHGVWSGHGDLPEDAREEVQLLVADVDDPRERARIIYQLLQSRTRYISVQLGIGGWQPFDAAYVHSRRYGDCKALSNYLQALLREVGVESYPALIGAGRPDINPDFPRNGFNHVVLYVPFEDDEPLWLEATSQHLPFGQLGPDTEGRHALVVTPDGGELRLTTTSPATENREIHHVDAVLLTDGRLGMRITGDYEGHALGWLRSRLAEPASEHNRLWMALFGLSQATIYNSNTAGLEVTADNLTFQVDLSVRGYATQAGRRVFLNPNVARPAFRVPPAMTHRTQPVEIFRYSFIDVDSVRIDLPQGFSVEVAFDDVSFEEEDIGSYSASLEIHEDHLIYVRRLVIYHAQRPPEDYDRVRNFLQSVSQSDDRQIALVGER